MQERPCFHGKNSDLDLSIDTKLAKWIEKTVDSNMKTMETGCGYSTTILNSTGADHRAISPVVQEHKAIREWLDDNNFSYDNLTFSVGVSQDILPSLEEKLDLFLIDGLHSFPIPMVDFYYGGSLLKKGGYLIVDDIDIITGQMLVDFLNSETERWKHVCSTSKSATFQKLFEGDVVTCSWVNQPFCKVPHDKLMRIVNLKRAIMKPYFKIKHKIFKPKQFTL